MKNRKLDALVHEAVFKQKVSYTPENPKADSIFQRMEFWDVEDSSMEWDQRLSNKGSLPAYSSNATAFLSLLSALAERGIQIRLSNKAMENQYWWAYMDNVTAQGSTIMEALCLACVKLFETKSQAV